jgi:hypothetical protein
LLEATPATKETIVIEVRQAEVDALRRRNKELSETLDEFMQPEAASNVIEAWICSDRAPNAKKLKLLAALRDVCEAEGWL